MKTSFTKANASTHKRVWAATLAALCLLLASSLSAAAPAGKADGQKNSSSVFPKMIYTPSGSQPEGFTIGNGTTAYNGSLDGSIYKVDLRTGRGKTLVPVQDSQDCLKLGLRFDPRSNYLFVAGCYYGNAYIYDADNGALLMEYQLGPVFESVVNDLAITQDAVYFTDSYLPVLYRLPLSKNGGLPGFANAIEKIPLPAVFALSPTDPCCAGNGIVATPDGKFLIIGHSNDAMLYRVDLATYAVDAISVEPPLTGFLDGIAMKGQNLYIMTPTVPNPIDTIQVVGLDQDMLSGKLVDIISDPDLEDVASGAFHGNSLYVNNARYAEPPGPDTEYWVTKLKLSPKAQGDD
jgi:hypothetical protein